MLHTRPDFGSVNESMFVSPGQCSVVSALPRHSMNNTSTTSGTITSSSSSAREWFVIYHSTYARPANLSAPHGVMARDTVQDLQGGPRVMMLDRLVWRPSADAAWDWPYVASRMSAPSDYPLADPNSSTTSTTHPRA
jgi:hypothetical protein